MNYLLRFHELLVPCYCFEGKTHSCNVTTVILGGCGRIMTGELRCLRWNVPLRAARNGGLRDVVGLEVEAVVD